MKADPWRGLRGQTSARIALGRAGGSLPTAEVLDFAMAHAAARDAVHDELTDADLAAMEVTCRRVDLPMFRLHTAAADRTTYLRRPDLGRRLNDASCAAVDARRGEFEVAIVIGDGLSALAIRRHAASMIE